MKHWPSVLTILVLLVIFGSRWFGPSDLYDNDQPKTVAYTVDMVNNGHWLLPMDMLGRPATKPPMYNWIGAPAVAAGYHSEFALKLPSTLAAFVTVVLTWFAGRWTAGLIIVSGSDVKPEGVLDDPSFHAEMGALACIALLANYMFVKLCYTARPDMVLTAFLTAGWLSASVLLFRDAKPRGTWLLQLVLWLCVAGAALTKGPPALLLVIYVLLGGKLLGGRWSKALRTGIVWGLPLAIVLTGLWAWAAYQSDPVHFNEVFLGRETVERVGRGGVLGILTEIWKMPVLFVSKFLPWSVFAIMGAWHVFKTHPRRQWFADSLGPAMLWALIVIVFFSLSGGKRADYLAPAFPAGAVLAAFWLVCESKRLLNFQPWRPAVLGLVVALGLAAYEWKGSAAARDGYGDHVRHFVQIVELVTCNEPIRFDHTGYTPIQPLMGVNRVEDGSGSEAVWVIRPYDTADVVVKSGTISVGDEQPAIAMGLYLNRPVEQAAP